MKKVAVVGAGTMGGVHSGAYAKMPNAELVAIMDILPEAAQRLAEVHSVAAYTDLKQMLAQVEVDVVDLCVPTNVRLDCMRIAVAAGKHICAEKPLGRTIGQAQEAVRICEEAGVVLFVAQVLRWFPEYKRLHDLIVAGAVGKPVVVRTTRSTSFPRGTNDWFTDMKASGGVVLDMIIHDFDWLRWCFGKVKRVYARGMYEPGYARWITLWLRCGSRAGSWLTSKATGPGPAASLPRWKWPGRMACCTSLTNRRFRFASS